MLNTRIATLKAAAGNDVTLYMEMAIRFVQDDIRYMGIEMGPYSHQPHTPEKVLAQRFGDCKDKSLLLCTLLRANGIAADMAYANTDEGPVLNTYLPSPDNFNHAIVHASLQGKNYWIDPTISYQRGKLQTLATPDYGQSLIVNDTTTGLTAMNTRPAGDINIHEEITISDKNTESATLKVTSDYTHYFADDIRGEYAVNSVKEEEDNFLSFYKKIYGDVVQQDSLITIDSMDKDHFRSVEHYIIHKPWRTDSADLDKRVFNFRAKVFLDGLTMIDDEERKEPVALRFPYRMHYVATFNMHETPPQEEQEFDIKNAYYHLHFKPVATAGKITLYYDYETFSDHVPEAYVRQYIKDINRITDVCYLNTEQSLNPGGNTLADSRSGYFLLNFTAAAVLLFCLGLFGWLAFNYFHRYHLPVREDDTYAWNLGGMLLLLGIGLFLSFFFQLDAVFRLPVFNYLDVVKYTGNKNWQNGSITEMMMLGQLAVHVFFFVYSILLAFLLYYRREIFPVTAIVYFVACTVFSILEVWLASGTRALGGEESSLRLAISVLGACIWIPYLYFSRRVRETFVLPHPSREMKRHGF
ncbi:Transglutaminase-like superfamily protein [Chitinophaga costaii]|uniref:Transglutaminase-like superfamily protein n=1 Tax=Chitinophaga costaii TaxID=1335309 RepID=A0A1C4ABR0_9BACT|nr:DUF2569 family protein [Chitinophaga costaii]SCB92035.1 Transglutaminase-like superfamily protein [Chitinophaga costaii]